MVLNVAIKITTIHNASAINSNIVYICMVSVIESITRFEDDERVERVFPLHIVL